MPDIYSLKLLKMGFWNFKIVSRKSKWFWDIQKTIVKKQKQKQNTITAKGENSMHHVLKEITVSNSSGEAHANLRWTEVGSL